MKGFFVLDPDQFLSVACAVLGADGKVKRGSEGFARLLSLKASSVRGADVDQFLVQPRFCEILADIARSDRGAYSGMLTFRDADGTARTLLGRVWRQHDEIQILAEYDIVELERLNDTVVSLNQEMVVTQQALARANAALRQRDVLTQELALTDALTSVGNRRHLDRTLAVEISRARRGEGPLSAVLADIDHFKSINDRFGHATGDTVLAGVAALLTEYSRATDIVTRYGGEEFAVLMPHTDLAGAETQAERMRDAIQRHLPDQANLVVTASFGVAQYHGHETPDDFVRRLDAGLYRAKNNGRNQVGIANAAGFNS